MQTVKEALSHLQTLTNAKISQEEFGKALGTGRANINKRIKNNSYLTVAEIKKLEKHFNVEYTELHLLNLDEAKKLQSNDDCVDIPVRGNLSASLGQGIEIVDETQTGVYSVSRKLMKDVGANPQDTDFVPCEGDSMFPTIEGGSLLMVDRSKKEVFDGKIYCIRLNGNLIAKRLQFIPPNSVKVISDNKEKYDPFYVDLSKTLDYDFEIIGEVKWYGTIVR